MNVSYRWLRALIPGLEATPEEVTARLALRGAPVEDAISPGTELGDVLVAKVVTTGPHPNADRLSLCTVDAGAGIVQVVCGAPNVEAGAWYPFAPVGAVLPGDVRIKKSKIRGELSEGMLCSARELGLGSDHTGILKLAGEFRPGDSFVRALGLDDVTLDVEVTPNRGDLLSHIGVARELADEGVGAVRLPPIPGDPGVSMAYAEDPGEVRAAGVSIAIEDGDLCWRYLGAVIRGLSVGPSPAWLQERLRGAGARPINNVVDATNYVMLELGQPLHAFDLHRLTGKAIVVRRPRPGEERFVTLDDEERTLGPDMLMICDGERPVAIGGVMGGRNSEVEAQTVDVLLECALFDPRSIRATRRALGMSTDASYRFERGVDPDGMRQALERAAAVILATAGGTLEGPVLDVHPRPPEWPHVSLRLSRIERVLGVRFDAGAVRSLLEPLGFRVVGQVEDRLEVRIPGFRSYDVTREIDLIEEVARAHGYDAFPSDAGPYRASAVPDDPMFQLEDELRDALVGMGFLEAQTPAFVGAEEGEVRVANPLNTREPYVRREVLPSLLRRVEYNLARGSRDVRLFEVATSFRAGRSGEPPLERSHVAVAAIGLREPAHWSVPEEPLTLWDVKAWAEELARRTHPGSRVIPARDEQPLFAPDSALTLVDAHGAPLGLAGRVRADRVDTPPWAGEVWGLEMALPEHVNPRPTPVYHRPPQHPPSDRDLALVVSDGVEAADVLAVIRRVGGELLESVDIFDHYRGEGIPPHTRSLAFRLRFRGADRTLKDREVDRSVQVIVGRLKEELGVEQRG